MIARRLYVVMGGMLLVQAIPAVCADKRQEAQQAELKQQATLVAATQLYIQPSAQSLETSPASSNNSTPANSPELNQRPKAEFPKQEQPKQERPKSGSGGGILNYEMQQEARRKESDHRAPKVLVSRVSSNGAIDALFAGQPR